MELMKYNPLAKMKHSTMSRFSYNRRILLMMWNTMIDSSIGSISIQPLLQILIPPFKLYYRSL